jgi:hypothetical protein
MERLRPGADFYNRCTEKGEHSEKRLEPAIRVPFSYRSALSYATTLDATPFPSMTCLEYDLDAVEDRFN